MALIPCGHAAGVRGEVHRAADGRFPDGVRAGGGPGRNDRGHDLDLLARLFPALGLQQIVSSGKLPGARLACQIMDEIVYPLATAPPARRYPAGDAAAGGKLHG